MSNEEKRLRVALCLSGQPRFHNGKSYESLKREVLDKYDTDVFIHSWLSSDDTFEYPHATWSNIKDKIKILPSVVDDLVTLYNPKTLDVEEPKKFEQYCKEEDYLSNNMPSMFYSMKTSDDLRKRYSQEHGSYDFVVRARTDTLLISSLPDFSTLDKSTVYMPDNCGNPILLNDNFSIAGGNVADKAYTVFDNIWNYSNEGTDYSPEKMWTTHLFVNGIAIQKMNIEQSFVRSWD